MFVHVRRHPAIRGGSWNRWVTCMCIFAAIELTTLEHCGPLDDATNAIIMLKHNHWQTQTLYIALSAIHLSPECVCK